MLLEENILFDEIECVNFTNLKNWEKDTVLKWRNNENIRKWMFNTDIIKKEEHYNYIETLINNEKDFYYLIKLKNEMIGVINLKDVDLNVKTCHMGIYANPDSSVNGKGSILLNVIINLAFFSAKLNIIKLEVFEENIKAINFYLKHKFIKTGVKKHKLLSNETNLITMELNKTGNYENR